MGRAWGCVLFGTRNGGAGLVVVSDCMECTEQWIFFVAYTRKSFGRICGRSCRFSSEGNCFSQNSASMAPLFESGEGQEQKPHTAGSRLPDLARVLAGHSLQTL